jgi:hypothetical protein
MRLAYLVNNGSFFAQLQSCDADCWFMALMCYIKHFGSPYYAEECQ